jgi:two-component system sensor kinase FixL
VNWIVSVWSMIGGMSLALGLVYLVVWARRREHRHHLLFAGVLILLALGSQAELRMMNSATPEAFRLASRLGHATLGLGLLFLPIFVRARFEAGKPWLLWTLTALRAFVIAMSWMSAASVHFLSLVMKPVTLAGVQAWVPSGPANPWILAAQLNLLLVLVFLADVLVELRRRGDPDEYRRGWMICGAIAFHVVVGGGLGMLVAWGWVQSPFIVTPTLLVPILVLSYTLGEEVILTTRERARLGRSESLLRESEQGWELAGHLAGMGHWSWNAGSDRVVLSARAQEMFGVSEPEISRLEWLARVHPEDAERVREQTAQALQSESHYERDYRILLPDGQARWITTHARIRRDAAGAITSVNGISFDMTRVRRADAMFRAALEAAPDALFLIDGEGRIQLANARASLMFGYSNEELLSLPLARLVPAWSHRPERRRARAPVPPAVERRASSRELEARRRDGSAFQAEVALNPVDGGLVLASVGDITDRLLAEHESAQQRTELAHLSRVAMIGEMSSSLAHELNQPLTAIVSNSQAALRFLDAGPAQQDELRETLGDIAASGTRAGEVIRRLRAMLRKEEIERRPLDVNQLISEVMQLYRSDLINRGVSVLLLLDRDLPEAIGDRVQLQQVLLNLVINACDAMAGLAGERKLTIVSRALGEAEVGFSVWDIGPGVEHGSLDRVFEPFVTSKADGMGLGLSVCKTIVKSHGGRIWAERNDGPGASFHVALPARVDADRTTPQPERAA